MYMLHFCVNNFSSSPEKISPTIFITHWGLLLRPPVSVRTAAVHTNRSTSKDYWKLCRAITVIQIADSAVWLKKRKDRHFVGHKNVQHDIGKPLQFKVLDVGFVKEQKYSLCDLTWETGCVFCRRTSASGRCKCCPSCVCDGRLSSSRGARC